MRASKATALQEQYVRQLKGRVHEHLDHLYDDPNLTFAELKQIILAATEGRLEHTVEKIDGMALTFTLTDEGLRVARSNSEMSAGGLDAEGIAEKFRGHRQRNVEEAFNVAFAVLRDAMDALSDEVKDEVFDDGRSWYSIEVVYAKNPNVIDYDHNCIVFHSDPAFTCEEDGTIVGSCGGAGVKELERHIDRMQKAVALRNWQLRGPAIQRLKRLTDGSVAKDTIDAIERAQATAALGDEATIGDYLFAVVSEEVADLGLSLSVTRAVTDRIVGTPGAPGLPQIKKMVSLEQYDAVRKFVNAAPAIMKRAIAPIESAIHVFAVEVLKGMHSVLVSDADEEVIRIRRKVAHAIVAIEQSGDVDAMSKLRAQVQKLGSIDNITSAIEGVVFRWHGRTFKLTGNFAPVNQILGIFRYSRGTVKPASESTLSDAVNELIERGTRRIT